ncbi:MAG: hypothetical protein ISR48_02055 [Alphaproteobacteria bacterium]|nr:hypothetical protein [Alphaproteobacteria bacterium]
MAEEKEDYQSLIQIKHFFDELEQGIQLANREIIHNRIDTLTKEKILGFAVIVGRLRGRYLEAAFNLSASEDGDPPDMSKIEELQGKRLMFEEAKQAFADIRYAIEKGYIDVDWGPGNNKAD